MKHMAWILLLVAAPLMGQDSPSAPPTSSLGWQRVDVCQEIVKAWIQTESAGEARALMDTARDQRSPQRILVAFTLLSHNAISFFKENVAFNPETSDCLNGLVYGMANATLQFLAESGA